MTITITKIDILIFLSLQFFIIAIFIYIFFKTFIRVQNLGLKEIEESINNIVKQNNKLLKNNMQDITFSALNYAINENSGFKNLIKNLEKVNNNVKLLYNKVTETEAKIKKLENDLIPQIQLLTNKTIEQEKYIKRLKRKLI